MDKIETGINAIIDTLDYIDDLRINAESYGDYSENERLDMLIKLAQYCLIIQSIVDEYMDSKEIANFEELIFTKAQMQRINPNAVKYFNPTVEKSNFIIQCRNKRFK